MIDYDRIGQRIYEERKKVRKITQERMAEDLGMYQADVSNLEKAKNGSGINDLNKLDLIADYFNIPIQNLLVGGGHNVEKYLGDTMKIRPSKKKLTKLQQQFIETYMGEPDNQANTPALACGPYVIVHRTQVLQSLEQLKFVDNKPVFNRSFPHLHVIVFYKDEVVATMTTLVTNMQQHIFRPMFEKLREVLPPDSLDPTDVLRTLNPYWALYMLDETSGEQYKMDMAIRMDTLRAAGAARPILYLDSLYVKEDYRQHGICRMLIDVLKFAYQGCIIWLNLAPVDDCTFGGETPTMPIYTLSAVGQLSMNAAIAEKLGFTVDPDVWYLQAEVIDENGETVIDGIESRKCAFYLPKEIKQIIADDGDLVARGRSLQHQLQYADENEVDEEGEGEGEEEE